MERRREPLVVRFTRSERALHWLVAGTFLSLLVSGVLRSSLTFGPLWHKSSAAAMVAGALLLVARARGRRVLRATAADLATLTEVDQAWLRTAPSHMLGRRPAPPAGRFNAGQKLHARVLAVLLPLALLSGLAALTGLPGGGAHAVLAYASAGLVGAHVFMAVLNPQTRHSLRGMVRGTVRREWAERHHALWVSRAAAPEDAPAPPPGSPAGP